MVGDIPHFGDWRLERLANHSRNPRDRKRAGEELQRRRRNRRRFVRGLNDDELKEIIDTPSWRWRGSYDSRALDSGVDVDGATLKALAEEEKERRERERAGGEQATAKGFEPFCVVSR